MCFLGIDIQVRHFNLRFGPRQPDLAFKSVRIVILVGQQHCLFARPRHDGAEGTAHGFAGWDSYAAAQTEHWIEHRAGRIRQRPVFHHRNRIGGRVAPAEEPTAISFVLHSAYQIALDNHHVSAPDGLVLARTLAAMCQNCVFRREEFRFDEKVTESRMGGISLRRVENHLCVACQFDLARARRAVG